MLKRLGWRLLRLLIRGLRVGDGDGSKCEGIAQPDDVKPGGHIGTSCVRFRDELITVLHAAGYTTYFTIDCAKDKQNGSNKQGKPIIARHTAWRVFFSDEKHATEPKLTISEACRPVQHTGTVWCVCAH